MNRLAAECLFLVCPLAPPQDECRERALPVPATAPETPLGAKLDAIATRRFDELIARESMARRLNPRLVKALIAAESEFRPLAVSPAGARGLMQVMPGTARLVGVPPERLHDPEHNIRAGTRYLADLHRRVWRRYGLRGPYARGPAWATAKVLAAYHAGPRALGWQTLPRSTRLYVRTVLGFYAAPGSRLGTGDWESRTASRPTRPT